MKVTIQDVLDAGGKIRGLPVKYSNGDKGLVVSFRLDEDGDVWVSMPSNNKIGANTDIYKPYALTVLADGIRVLEIDGELYRVTGHIGVDAPTNLFNANNEHRADCILQVEPLIPEKKVEPNTPLKSCIDTLIMLVKLTACDIKTKTKIITALKEVE